MIRKEKRDGNKDGWAREFEIEDQYSPDQTKASRPSRNVKTHARNADERKFVHFPVERVSRASASSGTLVWQEIVKKETQRVVARLRPAILGPIFIYHSLRAA